ncbi:ankyrin repeat-containing domain protein [Xylaria bambusicola]|uniref:ankyrin repeat-containing domain protein n=1 Tax=Xylaria bambusicola TaxID=326684 RepID=UPI002007FDCA|nr:ankyrin repeat-containing domain protein [Xylaria bambusicola]KAI0509364.1 ankyrin repeat-containing domain protein [Xylaria bambusicola]
MTRMQVVTLFGLKMIVEYSIGQEYGISEADTNGRTALHIAAEGDYLKVAELLLDRLPGTWDKRDHHWQIPLHLAALNGHWGVVKFLVTKYGVNPDTRDRYNRMAFH